MKDEPAIDKESLIKRIREEYGLDILRVTFLPKGMVGYCYLVDCSKGDRYLLKLYDPKTRLGLKSIDRLDWYLPLTWNLYFKGFFPKPPLSDKNSRRQVQSRF